MRYLTETETVAFQLPSMKPISGSEAENCSINRTNQRCLRSKLSRKAQKSTERGSDTPCKQACVSQCVGHHITCRAPTIHQKCCIGIQQGYSRYSRYSTNLLILGVGTIQRPIQQIQHKSDVSVAVLLMYR